MFVCKIYIINLVFPLVSRIYLETTFISHLKPPNTSPLNFPTRYEVIYEVLRFLYTVIILLTPAIFLWSKHDGF